MNTHIGRRWSYKRIIIEGYYLPMEISLGPDKKSKSDSTVKLVVLSLRLGTWTT